MPKKKHFENADRQTRKTDNMGHYKAHKQNHPVQRT